ncbi:MAG: Veg family protein [Coriobacteriales bacterium]
MEPNQQLALVEEIHDTLDALTGQRLKLRANMGRSKIIEREGTLVQVHPSIFIVETDEKRGRKARQSYQYVDILTKTVELTDPASGENLFPALAAL